jgi:hypothetical protein
VQLAASQEGPSSMELVTTKPQVFFLLFSLRKWPGKEYLLPLQLTVPEEALKFNN